MTNLRRAPHPKPLVLLAAADAWLQQELADTLVKGGYRVTVAPDARTLLEQMHAEPPDAIVVDSGIEPPGFDVCSSLRTFALATPIVLILPGVVARAAEHDALRAGAWAVLGTPPDADALLLRLAVFVTPKRELERVSEERLIDHVSGLYNASGLTRRAAELAGLATRHGLALTCAVFRPATPSPNHYVDDRLALAFKSVGRVSDALGRTGLSEFAVFAPASNTWNASRLVRRITDNLERAFGYLREGNKRVGVRAGYSAAREAHKISPPALLVQARNALDTSPSVPPLPTGQGARG
jgi:PleD family two-component response regulator